MFKSRLSRTLLAATMLSTLGLSAPNIAYAQDIAQFATYDAESTLAVDTSPYREIMSALSTSERGRTLVAYDVAHASALPFFDQYITYLENIPVERLGQDEQLAYWLNTRNMVLVRALAEERRVRRFERKRGTPSEPGDFWTEKRITVAGVPLSLQEIEQDILFANWDNPNIIFGLYQGMAGGPVLPRKPFMGDSVQSELQEAGRRFLSSQRNFRVRRDTVRVSSYFDWYLPLAYDNDEALLREHLSAFATAEQQDVVRASGNLNRRNFSTDFEQYRARELSPQYGTGTVPRPSGVGS